MLCKLTVEVVLDDSVQLEWNRIARDLQAVIEVGLEGSPAEILPGVVSVKVQQY